MTVKFYLIVNDGGSVRTVKSAPDLKWNEISIRVQLDLPGGLFVKPAFEATITVPETAVAPKVIAADVADNIQEAIQQATGYTVKLSLVQPENQ